MGTALSEDVVLFSTASEGCGHYLSMAQHSRICYARLGGAAGVWDMGPSLSLKISLSIPKQDPLSTIPGLQTQPTAEASSARPGVICDGNFMIRLPLTRAEGVSSSCLPGAHWPLVADGSLFWETAGE